MIHIALTKKNQVAGELVYSALCRSFSRSQVRADGGALCRVIINPDDEDMDILFSSEKKKILLLGSLPPAIAQKLHVTTESIETLDSANAACAPASIHSFRESRLTIHYRATLDSLELPLRERALLRYDFMDEWNNLGYGAIPLDGSIWSLSQCISVPTANVLADVTLNENSVSAYAAIWNTDNTSILWFNRAVGPIDSAEWRLVEYFFSSFRHAELSCVPVLSEIPEGWDVAVTQRLDCDEDIASARALFESYQSWSVPFSLAVQSSLLGKVEHTQLMFDVIESGGAILSHSDTHPVRWGGSYDIAFVEATISSQKLHSVLNTPIRYAVSPFHQTPVCALHALSDAGFDGCVGGIINCDPEFLMARGGVISGIPPTFIGHSQSCMLHGDCLLSTGDALAAYKQAFDIAKRSRTLFGFLDHPFSERYAYGWASESQRIDIHHQLINYIRSSGSVLFLNENDALDFIRYKNGIELTEAHEGEWRYRLPEWRKQFEVVVEFKGRLMPLCKFGVLS